MWVQSLYVLVAAAAAGIIVYASLNAMPRAAFHGAWACLVAALLIYAALGLASAPTHPGLAPCVKSEATWAWW